jgi:FAD/FMN-containing dehydrogenase
MAAVVWCCATTAERADAALNSIRKAARPAFEHIGPVPFPALQSTFDPLYPKGLQWYWKADYVKDISEEAVNLHLKFGSAVPTMHSTMHLYPINGAAHQPANSDTAWAYRDANWVQVIVGVDPDPANNRKTIDWTREYWNALHPYGAGGAYVNFMFNDEGQERVKAAYRENYARLAAVKKQYDPANFFRVNQNIQPAA